MFLFLRLLLAHFIADFPLQTKKIFELKEKTFWGSVLHAFVFFLLSILFCLPYIIKPKILGFIIALSILHALIDYSKLKITEKTDTDNLFSFLLDQALHIGLLTLVFFVPQAGELKNVDLGWLGSLYNNNAVFVYLTGLTASTYGSSFVLYYIKTTFIDKQIFYRRDKDGMIERGIVFSLLLLPWQLFLLIPVIVGIRILYYLNFTSHFKEWVDIIKRIEPSVEYQKVKLKSYLTVDLVGSPVLAVLIGIFLKNLL